ncbi:MAG: CRISPR-associated endonuclease Cas3'' [Dehalococcoidia bacterium]|nr:CRISPR-associated endonuclease Cas3'' [Dehalococcoidia bacterium]
MLYFAHSKNDAGDYHLLVDHLRDTAALAADFAAALGAAEAGRLLGLWHDLGKFNPRWQSYLLADEAKLDKYHEKIDHKGAGARLAANHLGWLALAIQGHHGGLRDRNGFKNWYQERSKDSATSRAIEKAREVITNLEPALAVPLPAFLLEGDDRSRKLTMEFFVRLMFSALIDADRLDTEHHKKQERADLRGSSTTLADIWNRFEANHARFDGKRSDPVGSARDEIFRACISAAEKSPGLFRLTVPTGGGKTLSALGFALRHALKHGQRSVIVAVPYTTITEQTAQVYRDFLEIPDDAGRVVLEHHSAARGREDAGGEFAPGSDWTQLAAENWDAPVVVTTTVQLFESLFANDTSSVRKVHRLARSVIILDEAQVLPPKLLEPILDALQQLTRHYGTTVVLSTATQPAFEAIPAFRDLKADEIVPSPERYFRQLQRVKYDWRMERPLSWPEVADLMRPEGQAVAVVNTKRGAFALLDALGDPAALHLSTALCGAHRRAVIEEVKRRLAVGEPCRLVSTQVIEAGVDLDFPVAIRALGPLDSIVQTAGRCNREGKLPGLGRMVVFAPADVGLPSGHYRTAVEITRAVLGGGVPDLAGIGIWERYFGDLFGSVDTDAKLIQERRMSFDYPEVAKRFRMIDDETESLIITTYGSAETRRHVHSLLAELRSKGTPPRELMRRLQPYLVSLRKRGADACRRQGLIADVMDGVGEWLGGYDPVRGLTGQDLSPDNLVV